jgi:hypothetical protein
MTWKQILIARLLLLIARMVADDPVIANELKNLTAHISVHGAKGEVA